LLTDWLGTDPSKPAGIQLLWPFNHHWFISGWNLFPRTERQAIFSAAAIAINFKALLWEVAVFGTIVFVIWRLRRRATTINTERAETAT
jgi:hypothetical protein